MSEHHHLNWPFFDPSHRSLEKDLSPWVEAQASGAPKGTEEEKVRGYVAALGQAGWLKFVLPASEGGPHERVDLRSLCLIRESLAYESGLLDVAFAMQGLGSYPITAFANKNLREKYLGKVASGKAIAAFAISEKGAGSDLKNLSTQARKEGNSYVLNGSKTWISNAGIADFYVVFAKTDEKKLSAFVVDADTEGVEVSEKIRVVAPHPLGSLKFENCKVAEENLIGEVGQGMKIALSTLDLFRSTVAAAALGFAKRAMSEAISRAKEREAFGQKIAEYQLIQEKIANMATEIDAATLLIYRAAWLKDQGAERVTKEAAMAKLYATEKAQTIIDDAVQIFGGLGVVSGQMVEELYREIRPLRIYEGTSEIQKLVIARGVME